MNQKIILFSVIFLFAINLRADKIYFTVIAKSGLSIRAAKSLQSERLAVVPFCSEVLPKDMFFDEKFVVEGIEGFWVSVEYKRIKGFMFSGFLFPGTIPKLRKDQIDEDYILMDYFSEYYSDFDEPCLSFEIFDRNRMWYGAKFEKNRTVFREVKFDIEINLIKNRELYERLLEIPQYRRFKYARPVNEIIFLKEQTGGKFDFFLGTNEPVASEVHSKFFYDFEMKKTNFQFLDFNESMQLEITSLKWNLKSSLKKLNPDSLGYSLEFEYENQNERKNLEIFKGYDWSKLDLHRNYGNPSLVWVGDLNLDNIPDFLFQKMEMADKCGNIAAGFLSISKRKKGIISFRELKTVVNLYNGNL